MNKDGSESRKACSKKCGPWTSSFSTAGEILRSAFLGLAPVLPNQNLERQHVFQWALQVADAGVELGHTALRHYFGATLPFALNYYLSCQGKREKRRKSLWQISYLTLPLTLETFPILSQVQWVGKLTCPVVLKHLGRSQYPFGGWLVLQYSSGIPSFGSKWHKEKESVYSST